MSLAHAGGISSHELSTGDGLPDKEKHRVRKIRAVVIPLCVVAVLAVATVCLTASHAAHAQSKNSGLALSNDKPIQIEADNLEIREQEKRAYFTGNVRVAQGQMTLQAGKMTVFYKSGTKSIAAGGADIDRIDVSGSVKLSSATQKVSRA